MERNRPNNADLSGKVPFGERRPVPPVAAGATAGGCSRSVAATKQTRAHSPCMNCDDEYREKAEEAKKQACGAISELERDRWLWLARGWLNLVRKPPRGDYL